MLSTTSINSDDPNEVSLTNFKRINSLDLSVRRSISTGQVSLIFLLSQYP